MTTRSRHLVERRCVYSAVHEIVETPRHTKGCDGIVDVHIETDRERRWRLIHRCRCGLDNRADAWRDALSAAEADFVALAARQLPEAAE